MPQDNGRPKFVVLDGATMQPLPREKRRARWLAPVTFFDTVFKWTRHRRPPT